MIMSAGGGNTGVHLSTPWTTFPFSGRVIVVWLFPQHRFEGTESHTAAGNNNKMKKPYFKIIIFLVLFNSFVNIVWNSFGTFNMESLQACM